MDIVLRSSGFGDSTVGKLPSMTACSSTMMTLVKPNLRSEAGTSLTPAPCMGE